MCRELALRLWERYTEIRDLILPYFSIFQNKENWRLLTLLTLSLSFINKSTLKNSKILWSAKNNYKILKKGWSQTFLYTSFLMTTKIKSKLKISSCCEKCVRWPDRLTFFIGSLLANRVQKSPLSCSTVNYTSCLM